MDGQSTEAAAVVVAKKEAIGRDDLVKLGEGVVHVLLLDAPAVGHEHVSRRELLLIVLHHPFALDNEDVHDVLAERVVKRDEGHVRVGHGAEGACSP